MLSGTPNLQDHLRLLHLLKTQGLAPFKKPDSKKHKNPDYDLLESAKQYWQTDTNKQLKLRELLIRYDVSKDDKEQQEIVQEILTMVPTYKDVEGFTKPTNLK